MHTKNNMHTIKKQQIGYRKKCWKSYLDMPLLIKIMVCNKFAGWMLYNMCRRRE